MNYTYQLVSDSGSFCAPRGRDVEHGTKKDAASILDHWKDDHYRAGADPAGASLLAWKGRHDDVTDLYPDFEVKAGPRGGARWGAV